MNHVLAALGVAAGLLAAAPAWALLTETAYQIDIGGAPSGVAAFDLDADVAGACRYGMEWGFAVTPSEQCFVDETATPGFRSCLFASLAPIASFVTLPPPGVPCQGIGPDGQSVPVYALSAAEHVTDGSLDGIIQLDSASTFFLSFHAAPIQANALSYGANVWGSAPPGWPAVAWIGRR